MSVSRTCDITNSKIEKTETFYRISITLVEVEENARGRVVPTEKYSAEGTGDVAADTLNGGGLFKRLFEFLPEERWVVNRSKKRGKKASKKRGRKKVVKKAVEATPKKRGRPPKVRPEEAPPPPVKPEEAE